MCLQNDHFHAANTDILEMQGSTFGSPRFPGSPRWCFQCGNTFSFCDVFLRFTRLYIGFPEFYWVPKIILLSMISKNHISEI